MTGGGSIPKPGQYALGELINRLKSEDPAKRVPLGFHNPHSWRGIYNDLAFEPTGNTTVAEMLAAAQSAVGATYEGYKGGHFTMDLGTDVWLAIEGHGAGETLGAIMLDLMLGATVEP